MSRGLGAVERATLAALAQRSPQTTPDLLAVLYGSAPTVAQVTSLRRAVRSLARKGVVVVTVQRTNVVTLAKQQGRGRNG
jgi:hypothetical protein